MKPFFYYRAIHRPVTDDAHFIPGPQGTGDWPGVIAGLIGSTAPPKPARPALLIIDMQRYFTDPGAPAYSPHMEAIIDRVRKLAATFSRLGLPVFATRYYSRGRDDPVARWWGTALDKDSEWFGIDPRLELPPGTVMLDKHQYGTFSSTDIAKHLAARTCDDVAIVGVMTDLCCETTAREAFQAGYRVYLIADATASSGPELHLAALRTLAHGFAWVLDTNAMLEILGVGYG